MGDLQTVVLIRSPMDGGYSPSNRSPSLYISLYMCPPYNTDAWFLFLNLCRAFIGKMVHAFTVWCNMLCKTHRVPSLDSISSLRRMLATGYLVIFPVKEPSATCGTRIWWTPRTQSVNPTNQNIVARRANPSVLQRRWIRRQQTIEQATRKTTIVHIASTSLQWGVTLYLLW